MPLSEAGVKCLRLKNDAVPTISNALDCPHLEKTREVIASRNLGGMIFREIRVLFRNYQHYEF